jgi:hypothetical protein
MKKYCIALTLFLFALATTASLSYALDVEGTYKYLEKGYSGTMTISRMGPGFTFKFTTESLSNGQMCDFETYETPMDEGGGRVDDELPAMGGTAEDGIKFKIAFKGKEAMVDMESKGDECGMSGYFGGKYVKTSE